MIEFLLSLNHRWTITRCYPPQYGGRFRHGLEPFPTPTHDIGVPGSERVVTERRDILPHGHIDDKVIAKRADRNRTGAVIFEAPDKPGRVLGKRIDPVKITDEFRH
jgi:hypothetical protein